MVEYFYAIHDRVRYKARRVNLITTTKNFDLGMGLQNLNRTFYTHVFCGIIWHMIGQPNWDEKEKLNSLTVKFLDVYHEFASIYEPTYDKKCQRCEVARVARRAHKNGQIKIIGEGSSKKNFPIKLKGRGVWKYKFMKNEFWKRFYGELPYEDVKKVGLIFQD